VSYAYQVIKAFAKSKAIEIAKALSSGQKTQQELSFEVKAAVSTVQRALEVFVELNLASEHPNEGARGAKIYKLTDTGKRILELLEEINQVYTEGVGEDKELKDLKKDLSI